MEMYDLSFKVVVKQKTKTNLMGKDLCIAFS